MIVWQPIGAAKLDGTTYLLWIPEDRLPPNIQSFVSDGFCIEGWFFSSGKVIDDGWETPIGFIGEPTHFADINEPDGDHG